MISPEVCNFDPPRTLMQTWTSPSDAMFKRISSSRYGDQFYSITVILPDVPKIPESVTGCFQNHIFYQVKDFPVSELVEPEFLETFIKKGCLEARSINNWTDVDDGCILHSSGKLELSVGCDIYQELGLTGHVDLTFSKKPAKYHVSLNLLGEEFKSGSKFHQRVSWCLKDRLDLKFDWVIKWKPHDAEICPSSLAAYLDLKKFKVKQCSLNSNLNRLYSLSVPQISEDESVDINDLIEWVGMSALKIECPTEPSYASSVTCPEPRMDVGQVAVLSWQGFFSADETKPLLDAVADLLKGICGPSWFNMSFHGFNSASGTGSELISLFITPSEKCYCFSSTFPTNKIK